MTTLPILSALLLTAAPAQPLQGLAIAGDGDSMTVAGQRIRLIGIDAPEFDQTCTRQGMAWACGTASAEHLSRLVNGRIVQCQRVGTDQYDRTLARCTVGETDINRHMVASGYAVAFRKYSDDYVAAEESAKAAKRGLWAGSFEMPGEVRAAAAAPQRSIDARARPSQGARAVAQAIGACVIKGNHSPRGEWIYHLPGMPYYEQTRPEALFCSEAEARAAGYRRAKVR